MALFLCSFGKDAQKNVLETLRHDALHKGKVDHVVFYGPQHPLIQTLRAKYPSQMDLGLWRPYLLHYTLHNMKDGDVLLYVDPSYTVATPVSPAIHEALGESDVLLYQNPDPTAVQQRYCPPDCFQAMQCEGPVYANARQVTGGVQMYRKTPEVMTFLETYAMATQALALAHHDHNHDEKHGDVAVLTNLAVTYAEREATRVLVNVETAIAMPCFLVDAPPSPPTLRRTLVITPTTGTADLRRCIESVQAQTVPGVEHLVVVDGLQYADRAQAIIEPFVLKKPVHTLLLPFNTGANAWNGHRVYASVPYLVDFEYIALLDEDNWYDPDHVAALHDVIVRTDADWAFSLRKIVDKQGTFVANDNCESLGTLCHTVLAWNDVLVDTSCYLFKLPVARAVAPHWMHRARQPGEIEADRAVLQFLLRTGFKSACSPKFSLNYTASHGPQQQQFFLQGNATLKYDFGDRPCVYVFHFTQDKTSEFLLCMHKDDRSYALDEWQMTLLRGLRHKFNLINGFAMGPLIPPGAIAYFTMCHPAHLPHDVLKRRDIRKIVYTIESPNNRHQMQWDRQFLYERFDHLLTYWTPLLLENPETTTFCRHNTHHLDLDNALDTQLLREPSNPVGKDVVMVLECRNLAGEYTINGVRLACQDHLRLAYVEKLTDITVYGIGWGSYRQNPHLKVGHTKHRSLDDRSSVDILQGYTFALIIENTNADGYVSEKIYDAFIAGCIPLYYGNNNACVGIPADMYIDVRQFPTSAALQTHLDKLSLDEIAAMRATILKKRTDVLRQVSTAAFAQCFEDAYHKVA